MVALQGRVAIDWQLVPSPWRATVALLALQAATMPQLHGLDSFAGEMQMAHAMLSARWYPDTCEYKCDPDSQNALSLRGQSAYVLTLLRMVPGL